MSEHLVTQCTEKALTPRFFLHNFEHGVLFMERLKDATVLAHRLSPDIANNTFL
jgi:hypothetical protein